MSELPDLTPAELARKHGLRTPLERPPSAGIVSRAYANREVVSRVAVRGDETGEEDAPEEWCRWLWGQGGGTGHKKAALSGR